MFDTKDVLRNERHLLTEFVAFCRVFFFFFVCVENPQKNKNRIIQEIGDVRGAKTRYMECDNLIQDVDWRNVV